jgi:hypothetical protein
MEPPIDGSHRLHREPTARNRLEIEATWQRESKALADVTINHHIKESHTPFASSPRSPTFHLCSLPVRFTNSGSPEKIEEVSSYLNNRFNQAFRSNFHGEKGLHPMEADVVRGFEKLLRDYETVQFMEGIKEALG